MHVPQMVIPKEKCLRHCRRLLLFLLLLLQWSSFYFLVLIESTPTPPLPFSSPVSMLFLPSSPACVHSFSSLFCPLPCPHFSLPLVFALSLFSTLLHFLQCLHLFFLFFPRLKCSMSIPLTSGLRFQSFIHLLHLLSSFFVLSSLLTFHGYIVSLSHLFYYFLSFHHTLVSFLPFCSFVSNPFSFSYSSLIFTFTSFLRLFSFCVLLPFFVILRLCKAFLSISLTT